MSRKKKALLISAALIALALCAGFFFGIRIHARRLEREEQQRLEEERLAVREYSGVMSEALLEELAQYPNLERLDLSGSEDYEAIFAFMEEHPQIEVRYTMKLGGKTLDNSAESLVLTGEEISLPELQEKLRWLPALHSLALEELQCRPEELQALRDAYPALEIRYTVSVLGKSVPGDAEQLDLTALTPEALEETLPALRLLPALRTVELTDANGGNQLGLSELARLQSELPGVLFRYRFLLFGKLVSTEDERIEYLRADIGNEGLPALREAIPCLQSCRTLLLDDCGIDNEQLAALREDFPQTKIVWRVHIKYLNFLTDVKVIHLTFLLTNQNAQVMRYCNEVEYLDIGHNSISDISFMAYMPHLRYVILSYNNVSDLSPLASCGELEMLELYQCLKLEDISPLASCESLRLLNISWTNVKDITPVYGLRNLERFYCIWTYGIPQEQRERCSEELPDCWITFEQTVSKNVGWSFDADGGVRAQWYLDMYRILRYRVEKWFFGDYPEGWNQEERRFDD